MYAIVVGSSLFLLFILLLDLFCLMGNIYYIRDFATGVKDILGLDGIADGIDSMPSSPNSDFGIAFRRHIVILMRHSNDVAFEKRFQSLYYDGI